MLADLYNPAEPWGSPLSPTHPLSPLNPVYHSSSRGGGEQYGDQDYLFVVIVCVLYVLFVAWVLTRKR